MQKHFIIVLVTNHENIPLHTFSVLIWGIDFTRGYAALTPGCIIAPIQGAGGMRHCVARLILWFTYINSLFTIFYFPRTSISFWPAHPMSDSLRLQPLQHQACLAVPGYR